MSTLAQSKRLVWRLLVALFDLLFMGQQANKAKVEKSFIILAVTLGALIVLTGLVLGGLSTPVSLTVEAETILPVQAGGKVASAGGGDAGFEMTSRQR